MTLIHTIQQDMATLPLAQNDMTFQYMALWTFVLGAALVWGVMFLRRNAIIRKIEKANQEQVAQFKTVLQYSRAVIYSVDLETAQVLYLSRACFSITGYTAREIKAMGPLGLKDCVHPDDRKKVQDLVNMLHHREGEREWLGVVQYRFRHRDGQYHTLSDHLHIRYDAAGKATRWSGSIQNISESIVLEESMKLLERKFQDSQKMAGLGLLASGIAHDFNNLMTVILGNAELALLDSDGTSDSMLDEITRASMRAAELAHQMLVYTGKTTTVVDQVNLSSVVREMASLLDVSISKKVKIEYCLMDDVPLVRGDISQIRQVAMNLITNASESIGDTPGVIAISIQGVEFTGTAQSNLYPPGQKLEGSYVRLEVSDTGSGMDPEVRQKIFDPLFTTKVTGRGLGLASLLHAVQRHNGAVEVDSRVGEGATFRVYFPAQKLTPNEEAQPLDALTEEWYGYGMALIADDEKSIRSISTALMERLGFDVIVGADGNETVDLYMQNRNDISILLLDLNMPHLNGLEVAQRVRYANPSLPIVFMSGYSREEVMDQFASHERTAFVHKPFRSHELTAAVRKVLEII